MGLFLQDGSKSLGLFRKGKIGIIAKLHRTDLVILSHSLGTKTPSYSRINTAYDMIIHVRSSISVGGGSSNLWLTMLGL